ncbi:Hypothetical protein MIP_05786 [Mycobacterium intracellulare subsp. intracellulare MTCC 9506]|uniref:Uncharacterized protein n=1 Tax=Mycobacterium indicus pranii (strain DSM 45239 / MTCC 9506) TaxID=1232724 RepID=J9WF89_MYCIP|nr:Hypothetical protein MIP_05786 [Mycobacterium intracellulare subsp. intracellulare MTCC 9506]
MQCGGIDLQSICHECLLRLAGIALRILICCVGPRTSPLAGQGADQLLFFQSEDLHRCGFALEGVGPPIDEADRSRSRRIDARLGEQDRVARRPG